MAAVSSSSSHLPSITAFTFRRGLQAGRLNLVLAVVVSILLTLILLRGTHGSTAFGVTFPLELPIFASVGSIGGLLLFVGDRSKGVLEYLLSYGMRPGTLFTNYLLTTAGLASLVVGAALAVGLGAYLAGGNPLTTSLEESVLGYTIPMTYASSLFATTAGILWSTLTTPRAGMNSPVGIAPMIGVAPPLLVLIFAESVPRAEYYYVTVGAATGFLLLVVLLLAASARLTRRERYLSAL